MLINHNKVVMLQTHQSLENSFNKLILTIKSCKTIVQLEGANRMVKNFKTLYREVGYPKVLLYSLDNALNKQHTICQL